MARLPMSVLDSFRDLMGTMSDARVARVAGVKRHDVSYYRKYYGISAYSGYMVGSGSTPSAPQPVADVDSGPLVVQPRPVQARRDGDIPDPGAGTVSLEAMHDRLGKVPDREVARLAGVGTRAVAYYRALHGIAPFSAQARAESTASSALSPRFAYAVDFKGGPGTTIIVAPDIAQAAALGMSLAASRAQGSAVDGVCVSRVRLLPHEVL